MNFPGGTRFNWARRSEVRYQMSEDERQRSEVGAHGAKSREGRISHPDEIETKRALEQ